MSEVLSLSQNPGASTASLKLFFRLNPNSKIGRGNRAAMPPPGRAERTGRTSALPHCFPSPGAALGDLDGALHLPFCLKTRCGIRAKSGREAGGPHHLQRDFTDEPENAGGGDKMGAHAARGKWMYFCGQSRSRIALPGMEFRPSASAPKSRRPGRGWLCPWTASSPAPSAN